MPGLRRDDHAGPALGDDLPEFLEDESGAVQIDGKNRRR